MIRRSLQRCALSVLLATAACKDARVEPMPASVAAAAPEDRGVLCADIGQHARGCWGEGLDGPGCGGNACSVPRPLPASARSAAGWRCTGMGSQRACAPRSRDVDAWQCDARACVQRHPRLPDQGEWDCAELDGVVRCTGGHPAAGVPSAPPEPGWLCGAKNGAPEARVCVDFDPDVPDVVLGAGERWKCKFLRRDGLARSCEPQPEGPAAVRLGATCSDASGCPKGALCAGRCLPPWPEPGCYLDDDCGAGRTCRFGTCAEGR